MTENYNKFLYGFSNNRAFTLLELIIVILLISIMAISLGNLTSNSIYGYIDAKDRNKLSQSSRWLLERLTREIREALPQSIRTANSGGFYCVEFMPITNASSYIDLPANGLVSTVSAVNFDLLSTSSQIIAIMPINSNDLYSNNGVLGSIGSISASLINPSIVDIQLTSPTIFLRRSPQNRFYLLQTPVSFCLNSSSGTVNRYSNYAMSFVQATPPANGNPIAKSFVAIDSVFQYQPGSLTRSGLLQISLRAKNIDRITIGTEESFEVFHEVHLRNVP